MMLIEYPDRDAASQRLADLLAARLKDALDLHPKASLAVPGGTTPGPIFDQLCQAEIDWARVTILLTDERWVPETHERSNAGLIRARLMRHNAQKATFLPFYKQGASTAEAVDQAAQEIDAYLPLSVLLLGMGADMHTASLFPGAQGLDEALVENAPALCPITTDSQPEPRVTLSGPVLQKASEKHVVIFGQDKLEALDVAKGKPVTEAPINLVLNEGTVHWAP